MAKVQKAIRMFRRTENCEGIRALITKLPEDGVYGSLVCDAYRASEDIDPDFYRKYPGFLAPLPEAFHLHGEGIDPERIDVAADMFRIVVDEIPTFF